ncbi:putative peptidyl-tRNA hydrolase PTRHD1 isoform X1 [Arctopsyche grandis]|uniref:putative peptidyl-tRNA hydrolase PTRHD1 isoform X1 n=1 Tax=Arctopsyche grandis TaxID=121162 RepID=UPI00406D90BC
MCKKNMTDIVQYILIRHDILKDMQWSIGAFVAQACHATVAIIHECADDPITKEYLSDVNNMHKVVLELPDGVALNKVAETLTNNKIIHKVWIEEPEKLATCIALKPYKKADVKKYLSNYKLYRHTIID